MKVLLCTHSFAPNVGGAETLALLLARGLSGQVRLTVVTPTPRGGSDDNGFPFAVVRQPGVRALWRLIRAADVVHLAGPLLVPLVMSRIVGTPVVVEHHGYQAICPNGLLLRQPSGTMCSGCFMQARYGACLRCRAASVGWLAGMRSVLLTFLRRWLTRGARANVAVTGHVARRLELPHTTVIRHGVPAPDDNVRRSSGVVTFGYVGRLVREKGLSVLLDAAARLAAEGQRFNLLMVGDGPERAALEGQATAAGLAVEFTGTLEGPALASAMARIDVAVMPSVWEETAGLSAMEMMRRGVPIIASRVGGLAEIVADGGMLVAPADAAALAAAMQELLERPERREALGAAARARGDAASGVERMIEEHAVLWQRVAAR